MSSVINGTDRITSRDNATHPWRGTPLMMIGCISLLLPLATEAIIAAAAATTGGEAARWANVCNDCDTDSWGTDDNDDDDDTDGVTAAMIGDDDTDDTDGEGNIGRDGEGQI
jgi:hypothetical protein